jgi:ABC-type nickel/cobalt efflux system permease component RcnA
MSYLKGIFRILAALAMQQHRLMQQSQPLRYAQNLTALTTIIALCALIVVSGPHLVHHLPEQYGFRYHPDAIRHDHQHHTPTDSAHHEQAAHHHTHSGHPSDESSPDRHPPRWPDCFVLFLMQHTPITGGSVAFLLIQLLIASLTVGIFCLPFAARWQKTLARAPPFSSLFV